MASRCSFVTINRRRYDLWRSVDREGMVLDILVQKRRNAEAAKRFSENILKSTLSRPRVVIITDGLRSYNMISREGLPDVEHGRSKYLNNQSENPYRPIRRQERRMQRFKSPEQIQAFLSSFGIIYDHFHLKKHLLNAHILS